MNVIILHDDEMRDFVFDKDKWSYKIPLIEHSCQSSLFQGFKYFKPETIKQHHSSKKGDRTFVVAVDVNNEVIGVIKAGIYGFTPRRYFAVSYIE
jgi:hypothetical protein